MNAHALTSGNNINGVFNASDYSALANALISMRLDWINNNIDGHLQPAYNAMTPAFINNSKIDIDTALSHFQAYNPQTSAGQLQAVQSAVGQLSALDAQSIVGSLQQQGMQQYFSQMIGMCRSQAASLTPNAATISPFRLPPIITNPGGGDYCGGLSARSSAIIGSALGTLRYLQSGIPDLGIPAIAAIDAPFWGPTLALGSLAFFGWGVYKLLNC